jgi:hypothetical protein
MKPQTRKKIEAFILDYVHQVDPSGENKRLYQEKIFPRLDDKALEAFIARPIPIYAPNGGKVRIDHMRNVEIMRKLGYEPEQKCWLTDPRTGVTSLTRKKHIVLPLPVRRQTQMIDKKISIADHNRTIDKTTGQATGASKGSSFSFPQIYVMATKGYKETIRELIKIRGGDNKARQAVDRQLRQFGSASQSFEGADKTRTKSVVTTGIIFRCMHIGTNLGY